MAICTIRSSSSLDEGTILAPERYHPGRKLVINSDVPCIFLNDIVSLQSRTLTPKVASKELNDLYVIDTGDVSEGRIKGDKATVISINSQKKILQPGQVIISRLRPYLRQVAYVDETLLRMHRDAIYICSTEFFVLESTEQKSIAFLVPFLLSEPVQKVFSNAIEGGQHPRFKEDVLRSLRVPFEFVQQRDEISSNVLESIRCYRTYEKMMGNSVTHVEQQLIELS